MNNLKRIGIFLAVATVLIVVSVGYKGNDIMKRSIVLGLGIDLGENGEVVVTAEVVSPGNGSEQIGTYSKTVTASGKTVAEALQSIALKSGKETSLGQCVLLMYGEEFIATDFSSTADYFIRSDSFKESAIVCCCKGRAADMLNNGDALSQSVSIALADKLKGLSKDVAIPVCDLLTYSRSQHELYKTGFLNVIEFVPSPNQSTEKPDQTQGFFVCNTIAVFRENKLVTVLDEQESKGFAVLQNSVSGNVFAVTDKDGKMYTLRANSKDVSVKEKEGVVSMSVEMQVKLARTDSFGAGGVFTAKTEEEIPQMMLDQVKEQSVELATLFLKKQTELDFDILEMHETFRQKFGTTDKVTKLSMSEIPVKLEIKVTEK
ncbi:MAG: hypothetical protein NC132_02685 [Corallococcus sp.]|nr:hypothetical protein [Corallococcus sp.]MCM1359015.1 hypothetical protein [Corallococcus sp.]MCM1395004.1 hypothetical protein [Corallococcus sp.]